MEIGEIVQGIKKIYDESVEPYVESSQLMAGMGMGNINMGIILVEQEQIKKYHSGLRFMGASKILEDELKKGTCTDANIRMFEANFAQFSLSVKSENTY